METCFTGQVSKHFQINIRKFRGWIHTKRWATLVFSVPEIRKIEKAMRLCWDKRKYQGEDKRQKEETLRLVSDVDNAVNSPFYWAYLVMQESIATIERRATEFAEMCPCHGFIFLREENDQTPCDRRTRLLER